MTTALITGHCGFIGRHLAAECERRGIEILGLDIADDTRDGDCRGLFRHRDDRRDFDLVFNCAATVGGRATIDGDPLAVATNLSLDAEVFNWAMRTRPGRVVYFSSSAAYPVDFQNGPRLLRERDIHHGGGMLGRPDQTYGWAKLTGEMLAEHVNAAGVPVHVFRPFSGYGSDQSADYPFGAFIDRALRRDDPFEVWGDGRQTRDFVHVDDIVGAVFAAIEHDVRDPVNLCTGVPTTFNELADLVTEAAGYRPTIKHVPAAPTGVQYRVGDPTLMSTFYKPTVTLEQGIERALVERGR